MTINELKHEIKKDLKIDMSNLDNESAGNVMKVMKYLDIFHSEQKKLNKIYKELSILTKDKYIHYRHNDKYVPETMKELDKYVLGDDEFSQKEMEYKNQLAFTRFLEETVKNFTARGWNIKTTLSAQAFKVGDTIK